MPTAAVTEADDDNDSEWDEDDESSEADDDGRIYKNPRNLPSTECPRDEEQATLLVSFLYAYTPFPFQSESRRILRTELTLAVRIPI